MNDLPVHRGKNNMRIIFCTSRRQCSYVKLYSVIVCTPSCFISPIPWIFMFSCFTCLSSSRLFFILLLLSAVSCIVDSFSDGNCDQNCKNCVITMSFGINAVKEYTAIAGMLMEPPTKVTADHRLSQRSEVRSVRIRLRLQDSLSCSLFRTDSAEPGHDWPCPDVSS